MFKKRFYTKRTSQVDCLGAKGGLVIGLMFWLFWFCRVMVSWYFVKPCNVKCK